MPKLSLQQPIAAIAHKAPNMWQLIANALQRIEDGVNNLGGQVAAEPVGIAPAPPRLEAVNVKAAGELVHVTLTHNAPVNRGVHYFVEYTQNDPNFLQPHVEHFGTSRGGVFHLPTKDDGGTLINYYFRGVAQYPGSVPTKPVNFGGITPTLVNLTGTTQLTLQPSTGSGTAAANGQQGGYGFGKTNTRAAVGPKRAIPA